MCVCVCVLAAQNSCMDALGKADSQHQSAIDKARASSEASRYHQELVLKNYLPAEQQEQLTRQQQQQLLQQVLQEHEVDAGDEALFDAGEPDALRLAALHVKDATEELSDAEEELLVNNAGAIWLCVSAISNRVLRTTLGLLSRWEEGLD